MEDRYVQLSELVSELSNPNRAKLFVRRLRDAVMEGLVDACELSTSFVLPRWRKDKNGEFYQKRARDMKILRSAEFETWFAQVNQELGVGGRDPRIPKEIWAYQQGARNFEEDARDTQKRLKAKSALAAQQIQHIKRTARVV